MATQVIKNFKAPVLPIANKEYSELSTNQLANILRLYFNQIDNLLFDIANVVENNVAYIDRANVFTKAQTVTPVALTDAATINTDGNLSNTFTVTLGGNRTLANPTNMTNGTIYNWRVRQDATGSRTLAYGSKFKWPGGTAPTLTTTASATDFISGQYFSDTDTLLCVAQKDFT